MTDKMEIAFLGTGLMGDPMARNLLAAGYSVHAWNRSVEKAVPLADAGAVVMEDITSAISGAQIVISMVSDGAVTSALIEQAVAGGALLRGGIWIDMSSTKPGDARACSETLAALGVDFADAPVSGGTKGAEAGSLAIMAGADAAVFDRIRPVLSVMGRPVRVGPVGTGQLSKLANQAIVGAAIGAVAEAMLLLERGGADPAAVRDALKGGFADSIILQQHGSRMTERDFVPGGLSRLQLKDLNNVLGEAAALDLSLPVVEHVAGRFARYCNDLGGSERDHSGLFEELCERNGITAN